MVIVVILRKTKFTAKKYCYCCLIITSCPTLCNPMDCSPPRSSVHGISQVRILEWVAVSFSRGSSWTRDPTSISCLAGMFFYHQANWEALCNFSFYLLNDDRGQDGWMASPTRWTCVWASSRSWWRTGRPGVLQSMGLQSIRHDWVNNNN